MGTLVSFAEQQTASYNSRSGPESRTPLKPGIPQISDLIAQSAPIELAVRAMRAIVHLPHKVYRGAAARL
jgi:hypothetical protein